MRFQLHYEYLVERTIGQFRIPIQVTPSIPALTRRLKVYINDNKPISCVKPETGSDYDDVIFNMINSNEAELETELSLNQTREFVITYQVDTDSKKPGTTLVDRKGYMFVSYTLPNSDCRALQDDNSTCPVGTVDDSNDNIRGLSVSPKKPFKLCVLFMGPGWSPGEPRLGDGVPEVFHTNTILVFCYTVHFVYTLNCSIRYCIMIQV